MTGFHMKYNTGLKWVKLISTYGAKYSRMDHVKFVESSL